MLDGFLRISLVGLLAFVGLVVGAAVGSAFVPQGSGMAGPAIVLWYGLGGSAVSLALGVVLALRAGAAALRTALLLAAVVAALAAAGIGYRLRVTQTERSDPASRPARSLSPFPAIELSRP